MYRSRLNMQGYTLIEAIFQLFIVAMLAQSTAFLYIICQHWLHYDEQLQRLNKELFVSEMNTYLMKTESFLYLEGQREIVLQHVLSNNQYAYIYNSANHIGMKMAWPTPNQSREQLSKVASGLIVLMPYTRMTTITYSGKQLHIRYAPATWREWERTYVAPPAL